MLNIDTKKIATKISIAMLCLGVGASAHASLPANTANANMANLPITKLSAIMPAYVHSQSGKFLPIEDAVAVFVQQDGDVRVDFAITDGHYVYQDKVKINGQTPTFSQEPTWIDDPEFGRVAVFKQDFSARVPSVDSVVIDWQACAVAGLCYPPERYEAQVSPQKVRAFGHKKPAGGLLSLGANANTSDVNSTNASDVNTAHANPNSAGKYTLDHQSAQNLAFDPFGLAKNPYLAIFLLFLAGLGLSLTACVYPMMPIVASMVTNNSKNGGALALAYALGVACAYGALGVVLALFGRALGLAGFLQNAWVLLAFALIFVVLGAMMMAGKDLRLPSGIAMRLGKMSQSFDGKRGSVAGSFLVGLVSALVVSPCVSAPLAAVSAFVAAKGSALFGFVALFSLGFGLSLPLVAFAIGARFLPKAGGWMEHTRTLAAWALVLVGLSMVMRVYPSMSLWLWAVWALGLGLWLFWQKNVWAKSLCALPLAFAALCVVGAQNGHQGLGTPQNLLAPIKIAPLEVIDDLQTLDTILANDEKVLVKMDADWCIECRIMKKTLFANPPASLQKFRVLSFDVTKNDAKAQAALARYELLGPPALLYYHQGKLQIMQTGEVGRAQFEQTLADF